MRITEFMFKAAALGCALALVGTVHAQSLLPAGEGDLTATRLDEGLRAQEWTSIHAESAALNYQRSLLNAPLAKPGLAAASLQIAAPTPGLDRTRIAESRQYYIDTDGAELGRGIELPLTAPGAVIRVSAAGNASLSLDNVGLRHNGRDVRALGFTEASATGASLRGAGWSVPENTIAFRLDKRVGAGTLGLVVDGLRSDQPVLVHVFEPDSPYVARLELNRQAFLAGQTLEAALVVHHPGGQIIPRAAGMMLRGDEDAIGNSMRPRAADGVWEITTAARAAEVPGTLHEVQTHVDTVINGIRVRRDLSQAVAIAPAMARLTGDVEIRREAGLNLALGVETALQGRYQLRGTLYASDKRGQLQPVALAESAAVLEAGRGHLGLQFDLDAARNAGYGAPFELRDLSLFDQGRLLLLEQRAVGLSVAD
ncbi:MAG: DUF4785 domain-containing protein [Wenzhouxiangellaceae bacterium]